MQDYQSITKGIQEVKRPMAITAAVGIIIQIAILVTGIVLNRGPSEDDYSQMEACYYGGKSLFLENSPKRELFNESTLKDIESKTFKMSHIVLVKLIGTHACDLVIEDDRGRRSYRFDLEKNSNFELFYRIANIKGQKLVSPYQWRNKL